MAVGKTKRGVTRSFFSGRFGAHRPMQFDLPPHCLFVGAFSKASLQQAHGYADIAYDCLKSTLITGKRDLAIGSKPVRLRFWGCDSKTSEISLRRLLNPGCFRIQPAPSQSQKCLSPLRTSRRPTWTRRRRSPFRLLWGRRYHFKLTLRQGIHDGARDGVEHRLHEHIRHGLGHYVGESSSKGAVYLNGAAHLERR